MAVVKSVEKLRKKPDSEKDIAVLRKAYPMINRQEMERITFLKKEGVPEIWEEVFEILHGLKKRQDLVRTVVPLKYPGGSLDFPVKDYDNEILLAKRNAVEYLYAHASDLLRRNNRKDARRAYYEFKKVQSYYTVYEDVDKLVEVAREKGTSHVFIGVKNNTIFKLPKDFTNSLIPEDLSRINSDWVEYSPYVANQSFDYKLEIRLNKIIISPSMMDTKEYTQSKELEDGFEYVLDENGNVRKDSLGNDIKIDKFKTISCIVKETIQRREIKLEGSLVYTDLHTQKVLKSVPIHSGFVFENVFANANGNREALTEEVLLLLKRKRMPIPRDFDMILSAGELLQETIYNAMHANKKVPK